MPGWIGTSLSTPFNPNFPEFLGMAQMLAVCWDMLPWAQSVRRPNAFRTGAQEKPPGRKGVKIQKYVQTKTCMRSTRTSEFHRFFSHQLPHQFHSQMSRKPTFQERSSAACLQRETHRFASSFAPQTVIICTEHGHFHRTRRDPGGIFGFFTFTGAGSLGREGGVAFRNM